TSGSNTDAHMAQIFVDIHSVTKNGIRAAIENGKVVKETLWQKANDPNLDLLDELSYDLYAKNYNDYDLKEYDYLLDDLKSIR
ncbi:MAG: hypothetical protein LUH51_04980, partial [Firmicutes bacterium]|nr:hypothetical protein [Bacillota bacterium]